MSVVQDSEWVWSIGWFRSDRYLVEMQMIQKHKSNYFKKSLLSLFKRVQVLHILNFQISSGTLYPTGWISFCCELGLSVIHWVGPLKIWVGSGPAIKLTNVPDLIQEYSTFFVVAVWIMRHRLGGCGTSDVRETVSSVLTVSRRASCSLSTSNNSSCFASSSTDMISIAIAIFSYVRTLTECRARELQAYVSVRRLRLYSKVDKMSTTSRNSVT